jgi:cell division protein FtsW
MASRSKYDHVLLMLVLLILLIGVIMITSIGVPKSIALSAPPELKYPDCASPEVDCYLLMKNHILRVIASLIMMGIAWRIPYRWWKTVAMPLFGLSIAFLVFLLFGGDANGTFAKSWINLPNNPFIDSFQPSELAKFGLIVYLSFFFAEKVKAKDWEDWRESFLKFAMIAGLPVGLIALQPDYGSALVLAAIATGLYILAGAPWRHVGLGALIAVIGVMGIVGSSEHTRARVTGFLNPDIECEQQGSCWQTKQANIAIGSGGFWGRGLTQGIQKSYWLPQASDDFVFAASAEELGFLKTALIVLIYAGIAYRGYQIANQTQNTFGMLLAAGITTWITAQSFINIMVNTALFPVTGITLPFMSYGGSSMLFTLFAIGVLLNISQATSSNAHSSNRWWNGRTRRSQSSYRRRTYRSF